MKFVHIADIHFDSPFVALKNRNFLMEQRILEQRNVFKKVIEYIKQQRIEYLFISGDLYENEHIKKSTIDFINNQFQTIPETKIFISPGNHDPMLKDSYYDNYEFAENVKIFKTEIIEKYSDENVEIYGLGFKNFYMEKNLFNDFKLENSVKPQILVMHGDLNGVKDGAGLSYNPIPEKILNSLEFNYVALGHIHKNNFEKNKPIQYPGSLISLGFDEPGKHGMIVGEIRNNKLTTEFIELDNREFVELNIDITNMYSQNDIIENINTLYLEKNNLYKITLTGARKFVINIREIQKFIDNDKIIKIKDTTKLGYDLEEIANETTLRGIYVRKLLEKLKTGLYEEEVIEKAIEIGLEAME
ncbi:MAG: DNA repair exonuclease [Clostridia bacterium]|nr:DNA repair exonuclease [Clostridia bacterium]